MRSIYSAICQSKTYHSPSYYRPYSNPYPPSLHTLTHTHTHTHHTPFGNAPVIIILIFVRYRFWKVLSSNTLNSTGKLTGYKLIPAPKCLPFAPLARAAHLKRAVFLDHQIWATRFHAEERYPGFVKSSNMMTFPII